MRFIAFYVKQIVLLGTPAFAAWVIILGMRTGDYWSSDIWLAWLFALWLVALFLVLVATPLQLLSRMTRSNVLPYVVGFLSGPVAVWIGLATQARYPIGFEWYVHRTLFLHVVFAAIGLVFAFNSRRVMLPRRCLWLALLGGVIVVLWCLNLVLFHWWAAYVPPQQTEAHLELARLSVAALAAGIAWVGFVGWLLYKDRPQRDVATS